MLSATRTAAARLASVPVRNHPGGESWCGRIFLRPWRALLTRIRVSSLMGECLSPSQGMECLFAILAEVGVSVEFSRHQAPFLQYVGPQTSRHRCDPPEHHDARQGDDNAPPTHESAAQRNERRAGAGRRDEIGDPPPLALALRSSGENNDASDRGEQ